VTEKTEPSPRDHVVRAMTDDGAFRVIAAQTTQTVQGAVDAQKARGETARWFGDLLTTTVLTRETMSPEQRVQGILQAPGRAGSLVADTHPDGATRGLVRRGEGNDQIVFGNGTILQMMRTLPSRKTHQGVVELPAQGGVPEALMAYMQTSEQVVSFVAVATWIEETSVRAAAGYIVQLLPEVETGPLAVMAERLADFESLDSLIRRGAAAPDALLDEILYRMPYTRLEERPVRFACQCSHMRVVLSLSTLSRDDIQDLIAPGETLEIDCDYCGKSYRVTPAQLRGLLQKS
jgi:molecular chaperone Hsp33